MTDRETADDIYIDGIRITSDAIVLQNRPLQSTGTPLSRFGDPVWNLFPALHDLHDQTHNICWDSYPNALRLPIK